MPEETVALPINNMEADVSAAAQAIAALASAVLANGVNITGTTLGLTWKVHVQIVQVSTCP